MLSMVVFEDRGDSCLVKWEEEGPRASGCFCASPFFFVPQRRVRKKSMRQGTEEIAGRGPFPFHLVPPILRNTRTETNLVLLFFKVYGEKH